MIRKGNVLTQHFLFRIPVLGLCIIYVATAIALVFFVTSSIGEAITAFAPWSHHREPPTISILALLDNGMVANVVYLITAGSYLVYVKDTLHDSVFLSKAMRPLALRHVTPGSLKEKMASSLVGVSSVYIATLLISDSVTDMPMNVFVKKLTIHVVLIVGFLAFALINRIDDKRESHEEATHAAHNGSATDPHGVLTAPSH